MPSPPTVSVLLPIYQAAKTMDQALSSLVRQTFEDFEVIAVDDGSKDESPQLLRNWAGRDGRIQPVFPGRQGLIGALNTGLARAQGEFVARMDADDVSHPRRLALQVALMRAHPEVSVASCLVRSFPRPRVREGFRIYEAWLNSLVTHEDIARELFIESPLAHPSTMMRRAELVRMGGYEDRGWPEDYDLWLRYALAGKRFAKVPEVLYLWREHPGRLSRTDGRYSVERFLEAKAYYLARGPLRGREGIVLWGAGQTGRRLSKHLVREGVHIGCFVDVDFRKIGHTLRGIPIIAPDELSACREGRRFLLAAVSSRGARAMIRNWAEEQGWEEGGDFLCVA
ncbi:MAG: glycosyltransferase [Candidatus Latescibacterota bacterium]